MTETIKMKNGLIYLFVSSKNPCWQFELRILIEISTPESGHQKSISNVVSARQACFANRISCSSWVLRARQSVQTAISTVVSRDMAPVCQFSRAVMKYSSSLWNEKLSVDTFFLFWGQTELDSISFCSGSCAQAGYSKAIKGSLGAPEFVKPGESQSNINFYVWSRS